MFGYSQFLISLLFVFNVNDQSNIKEYSLYAAPARSALINHETGFEGTNSSLPRFDGTEGQKAKQLPDRQTEERQGSKAGPAYEYKAMNAPQILSVTPNDTLVEQYDKFEAVVELDAAFDNPYDYEQINVEATFQSPNEEVFQVDGFYMQDYDLNIFNGGITPVGNGGFKIRFSPNTPGVWTYQVMVTDSTGTTTFTEQIFECYEAESSENKGFVRVGSTNYLEFDNGDQLVLIGENMAWQNNNAYINYRNWLTKLDDNGGNFIRLWHAHWGLGIEWKNGWQGFEGLRRYKERNGFYQDWLYDYCAERGIYVMLALQHHGPVSTIVNPNWNDSPYNVANGGMCANTWDFFTDEEARAHTRNRYRYIVARWGYSRAIQSWELFNEVNWTDDFHAQIDKVRDWHAEMAAYLKTIDPYKHLVSTSYAESDQDPVVWNNPDIDFTQTHFYINTSNIERALAGGVREYLAEFDKPTLTGEFGLGGSPSLSNTDPDGIHLHNALWGALMSGGMGTGMTWWWDVYVEPRDLYYHFSAVRTFTDDVPFVAANFKPVASYVLGAPGDLILTPSAGWGIIADNEITITETGGTIPANPSLGQFLYGSSWNTEYRSPPEFSVNYPEEGTFSVTTNSAVGNGGRISIYVNGSLVLNEVAAINTTYTVLVPSGNNLIKVDNLGIDWISISGYEFSGIGSQVDSYVLSSESGEQKAGWLLNHKYNHIDINAGEVPQAVEGGTLVIDDMEDAGGPYFVKWYDCITGDIIHAETVTPAEGQVSVPIPSLAWDLAFLIDEEEVVGTEDVLFVAEQVQVYPNPAAPGTRLRLNRPEALTNIDLAVTIYDAAGRYMSAQEVINDEVSLPVGIASGLYWLKFRGDRYLGSCPVVIR
jgi:hypothetical protein